MIYLKVYHIVVSHGTPDAPCTCEDDILAARVDCLPNDSELANFILDRINQPSDAPVVVTWS